MSSLKSQWQTCEWLKSIWCSLPPGSVMECKRNSIAQSPPVVMIICKKTITLNTREWVSEWVSGSVSQSVSQSVGQSVRSGQVSQVCQVSQVSQSVRVTSRPLGQLYDCPNANEATLGLYSLSRQMPYCKISRSLEAARFRFKLFQIALKFDMHLGSSAAEMPVKFQSDTIIIMSNIAASGQTSRDLAVRCPPV